MNSEQHLLLVLAEECAEVAQRITKALRFGLSEIQPEQLLTNEERIVYELCDIQGTVELLQTHGVLLGFPNQRSINEKKVKVRKFLDYSKELGLLDD